MQRFDKASRNVLRMALAGLKGLFSGLLTEPRKFITLVILVILLLLISYYNLLLLFLTPIIVFYIALWAGRKVWEERRKKPVGRLGRVFIFFVTLMIVTPCLYGFFVADTAAYRAAKLPKAYTDAGAHNHWNLDEDPQLTWDRVEQAGLARDSSRTYMYDTGTTPPYPGIIFIITIKSSPYTNGYKISDYAEADAKRQLESTILNFDYQGLSINIASKVTGTRTTREGNPTQYFEYNGQIDSTPSDPRFQNMVVGGKVKIRGEVWKCPGTGTVVAVAGVAQYGYTFAPGTFKATEVAAQKDYPDDYRTWTTVKNLMADVSC